MADQTYQIYEIKYKNRYDLQYEIRLTVEKGILWWKRECQEVYQGEGTVWHNMRTGDRADTLVEYYLSNLIALHRNLQDVEEMKRII
jgi:hypothetical protein